MVTIYLVNDALDKSYIGWCVLVCIPTKAILKYVYGNFNCFYRGSRIGQVI